MDSKEHLRYSAVGGRCRKGESSHLQQAMKAQAVIEVQLYSFFNLLKPSGNFTYHQV
jgi:hypothetical protein